MPKLGDTKFGFPYLSAARRLVINDVIMMGAAIVTMAQAAGKSENRNRSLRLR